ncbi:MAG: HAD-IIIC family phosphatase [Sedimentisphaerales bacterium]|jgi:FkbH-like protein
MDWELFKKLKGDEGWLVIRRAAKTIQDALRQKMREFKHQADIAFVSSYTADPLADYVQVFSAQNDLAINQYIAPYGQFNQELLNPQSELYRASPQITFLLIEAESDAIDEQALRLGGLVDTFLKNSTGILVINTFPACSSWPLNVLPDQRRILIEKLNAGIIERYQNHPRIQILDLDALVAYFGYQNAMSPQMMSMARIPFSEAFLAMLARRIVSHIVATKGIARKCLVLDCDNTLWGGIIGEDGLDGIQIGHDSPGREYLEFQKTILELYEQGIILAINSKNNPDDVMQVINKHPQMLLREKHFASIMVNWDNKPQNMQKIAKQINIGLDSIVFIDDNPAERELMRQSLPQVETLDMPADPSLFARTLRETGLFTRAYLTEEDKNRGQIYAAQRQREQFQQSCATLEDFLKSLEMVVSIHPAGKEDIKRIAQLTQRTNQFNLTTRRYTDADIAAMAQNPAWRIYILGLKDKFGDNGTVGLALIEIQPKQWRIDTFLMSCRVIGRQVEDALVDRICRDAAKAESTSISAEYIPTAKNNLVAGFWDKMGFEKENADAHRVRYSRQLKNYQPPQFLYLKIV